MQIGFNEGKACDAVLRRIELLSGAMRTSLRWPEREHHAAPVELVCNIGGQQFAVEHTGIEPFEGFMRLQSDALTHFRPLEARVARGIPDEEFVQLDMPLKATEGLRGNKLKKVQDALAAYVLATVPTLPIAAAGRFANHVHRARPVGVPFEIALHRWPRDRHAKKFDIVQNVSSDLEAGRRERIERGCRKKYPKLAAWKASGARTILVLEDCDIQLSGEGVVAEALLQAERAIGGPLPDEVYLVTTFTSKWFGHIVRVDDKTFFDFAYEEQPNRYWEIDPASLADVMLSASQTR